MPVQVDPFTRKVLVDATTRKVLNCSNGGGECPHAYSVSVKFDEDDDSDGFFVDLFDDIDEFRIAVWHFASGGDQVMQIWFSTTTDFQTHDIVIPAAEFFDVYHDVTVTMSKPDSSTMHLVFTVAGYGTVAFDANISGLSFVAESFLVGSTVPSSGVAHRQFQSAHAAGNPINLEIDFDFPADSFTSLVGGASIVGSVLRVDDTAAAYARKDLDVPPDVPGYILGCAGACCQRGASCDITVEAECTYIYSGDGTTCDPNTCFDEAGACCDQCGCVEGHVFPEDCFDTFGGPGTYCDVCIRTAPPPVICCGDDSPDGCFCASECGEGCFFPDFESCEFHGGWHTDDCAMCLGACGDPENHENCSRPFCINSDLCEDPLVWYGCGEGCPP